MIKKLSGRIYQKEQGTDNWIGWKLGGGSWITSNEGHNKDLDWWLTEVCKELKNGQRVTITFEIEDEDDKETGRELD